MRTHPYAFPSALAVGLLILGGCDFAPHYDKPAIAAPSAFKEAGPASSDVTWSGAQPGDTSSRGKWWELFQDAQLNSLEEQVQISNQTIAAAEANFRAAKAAVTAARSALYPTVTASPSYNRVRPSQTFSTGASSPNLPSTATTPAGSSAPTIIDEYTMPFEATYEADVWGRVRDSAHASAYQAQASAADLATALLSTQAALAQDYFELRALDAESHILDDTVDTYRKALDATKSLFNNGIDSEEDVALAQNQLDSAVTQATDLGVARTAHEHAIAVLIGKAPADFTLSPAPFTARPPAIPAGIPSELLERRPDVAAAERRVAAANSQIGVARAAYFPKLLLSASGGWESTRLSQWFDWPSRFWSLGPELAGTIFDGGARKAGTEEARAGFDQASANYRQTVLTAFEAVEDNLAALRILDEEAKQQHTSVGSSEHLLNLATTRFHTGIDSYLNVVTAQTALLTNRESAVDIQLRQMNAAIALVTALGGGWKVSDLPDMPGIASTKTGPGGR